MKAILKGLPAATASAATAIILASVYPSTLLHLVLYSHTHGPVQLCQLLLEADAFLFFYKQETGLRN